MSKLNEVLQPQSTLAQVTGREGQGYATGYSSGNIERWGFAITVYLPQVWQTIMKTIDPLVYASLIELLGSNISFSKLKGDLLPVVSSDNNLTGFVVTFAYKVPDFIGYTGEPAAVQQDEGFIYNKIQTISSVQWTKDAVKIDTKTGTVTIKFTIPVGY